LPGVFYYDAPSARGNGRVEFVMTASKQRDENGTGAAPDAQRRPFDTSDLARLPQPNSSDPPYRPFWVNDDTAQDR